MADQLSVGHVDAYAPQFAARRQDQNATDKRKSKTKKASQQATDKEGDATEKEPSGDVGSHIDMEV